MIQQRIDQNRGKVRVAADLSNEGIADIQAEERMRGAAGRGRAEQLRGGAGAQVARHHADRADRQGSRAGRPRKPSRSRCRPGPDRRVTRGALTQRPRLDHLRRREELLHIMANGQPKPAFYAAVFIVIVGLVGLALYRYGAIGTPHPDRADLRRRAEAAAEGGRGAGRVGHHHGQGIQVRRRRRSCPRSRASRTTPR